MSSGSFCSHCCISSPVTNTNMHEHVDSIKTYTLVFLSLLILTAATTVVATIDLGPFNVVMALLIAVVKMMLVALFFMHLRHSTILTKVVLVALFFMHLRHSTILTKVVVGGGMLDRKSTRLNYSHLVISYAAFCLQKKAQTFHYMARRNLALSALLNDVHRPHS